MNWIFVNGSPRSKGNTSAVLKQLEAARVTKGSSLITHEVYSENIRPCTDCRACKAGELTCPVADDMQTIYGDLEQSEIIVIASPIYWSGHTGPLKNLIDRLRPYYKNRKLSGKNLLIVSVGASADTESDLMEAMLKRVAAALRINVLGCIRVTAFDIGDVEGSDFDIEKALAHIPIPKG